MKLVQEAVSERPFPQLPLMFEYGFCSFLRDRGIDVGIKGVLSFVSSGLIARLNDETDDFHPFQIWPITRLMRLMEIKPDRAIALAGGDCDALDSFMQRNWPLQIEHLRSFPEWESCVKFNQRIFPLLLWIESRFLPIARAPRPGLITLANANQRDWANWANGADFNDWLNRYSVTLQVLQDWRDSVLLTATNCPTLKFWSSKSGLFNTNRILTRPVSTSS